MIASNAVTSTLALLPEERELSDPVTRAIRRRSLVLLALAWAAGLVLGSSGVPARQAFGLGLFFPGAGFLSAGHPFFAVLGVLLFIASLLLWILIGVERHWPRFREMLLGEFTYAAGIPSVICSNRIGFHLTSAGAMSFANGAVLRRGFAPDLAAHHWERLRHCYVKLDSDELVPLTEKVAQVDPGEYKANGGCFGYAA